MTNKRAISICLFLAGLLSSAWASAQGTVVVTKGSAAAYVFCPQKKDSCPVQSKLGLWLFKLVHADNVSDPAKKILAFQNGQPGPTWATVQDRWYVGFGEFKPSTAGSTTGTLSGYVDLPLDDGTTIVPALPTPITHYCTMNGPTQDVIGAVWPRTAPTRQCRENGVPYNLINTGVSRCGDSPFPGTWPPQGNCVANLVRLRKFGEVDNGACFVSGSSGCLYQARVVELYVREVRDPAP